MPLAPSFTETPSTPKDHHRVTRNQRTPNRAQINKRLQEFASQYPSHTITPAGFAQAVRTWAANRLQDQQTLVTEAGKCTNPAGHWNLSILQSPDKRFVAADDDELGRNVVSSPFKRIRIDVDESVHISLGEYNVTTPPRRITAEPRNLEAAGTYPASPPRIQGFTPINKPQSRAADSDIIDETSDLPVNLQCQGGPAPQVLVGSPIYRHAGNPSESSPSPSRQRLMNNIPTFSSGTGTAQRKAAPSRLNLELPGAAPHKTINEATHYVALPAFRRGIDLNIDKLQQHFEEMEEKNMTPGSERTNLLKTPIYNLEPEDMKDDFAPFAVRRIPRTPASALASAIGAKFTLTTPATAKFNTAARIRNMAAAQRAQSRIANQTGTASATGKPAAYQHERRLRRTDRILGAFNNGQGGSALQKVSFKQNPSAHGFSSKSTSSSKRGNGKTSFDLISALSRIPELAIGVAVYLPPPDVLTLYSVSVQFHTQINTYLKSSIALWTREWAPHASVVFCWSNHGIYEHFAIQDPAGRPLITPPRANVAAVTENGGCAMQNPWQRKSERRVPSIRWYQMVSFRDDIAIDILAHLARQGFRCPRGTKISLLKMWMIMDLPTNAERRALLARRDIFLDQDLLNIVVLLVKLAFRFSDPIYGPESANLLELMLGQRSLYSLWQMLFGHNYRDYVSLVQCKIRYDLGWEWHLGRSQIAGLLDPVYLRPNAPPVLGVPGNQIGRTHLEHWGEQGVMVPALLRPSECVMSEAARRQLNLDEHLMGLVIWGHVDPATGRNLAPTEEEIWMRDPTYKNRSIDTSAELTPFHCRKAMWDGLDERVRKKILLAQEIREESVYKWDEHKYDDPNLSVEENMELNLVMRDARLLAAGVDSEDLSLRVDANGNELSVSVPLAAAFMPGPVTSGLKKAIDCVDDYGDGHDSDTTVDSLEATMDLNDESKLQYAWKPEEEDHVLHIPRTASLNPRTQDPGSFHEASNDEDTDLGSRIDGDESFNEDSEIEYEHIWDMWEEMEPKVFKTMFDDNTDDDMDI